MSRQQSNMPDEPQETGKVRGRKDKPWVLWHCWRSKWWRRGRYRTKSEAETVLAREVRKYRWASAFWSVEKYRVLHEADGKPK